MRLLATALLFALALPAAAQTPPTLKKVTITKPTGTATDPFRTNKDLIALEFTSDAANGIFFAASRGADIPMSTFLVNTNAGKVGAGFLKEGVFNLTVLVSTAANVPTTQQIQVTSEPVTVVVDKSPPTITLTQIKLRPNGAFESFDPQRQYRTNADQIVLKGFATDGANGVSPDKISITTSGTMVTTSATPDASGAFELTVDIKGEPDGPIDLKVVGNDNVGDSPRLGNRVEVPVGLR